MITWRKEYVSVRKVEKQVHVKEKPILSNSKSIRCSKFTELCPKLCVLFSWGKWYAFSLCLHHPSKMLNYIMMLFGNVADLTAHEDIPLRSYISCHAKIACSRPQPACYLTTCHSCPGVLMLKDHLKILMDENLIDTVIYIQAVVLCWQIHPWNFQQNCWYFCGCFFLWEVRDYSTSLTPYLMATIIFPNPAKSRVILENSFWLPTFQEIIHLYYKMQPGVSIARTRKQPFTLLLHIIMTLQSCAI